LPADVLYENASNWENKGTQILKGRVWPWLEVLTFECIFYLRVYWWLSSFKSYNAGSLQKIKEGFINHFYWFFKNQNFLFKNIQVLLTITFQLRPIRRSGASGESLAVQLRELLARPLVEALDERDAAAPPERRREKSKHPGHRQISHLQCSPGI
jgi:hypothetical protein